MDFLEKTKKIDLASLAEELGDKELADLKVVELKDLTLKNKEHEEEFVKDFLDTIVKTRFENEENTEEELENRRKREEHEVEFEKIMLEPLKRSNSEETGNYVRETKKYVYDLQKLLPKFESGVT